MHNDEVRKAVSGLGSPHDVGGDPDNGDSLTRDKCDTAGDWNEAEYGGHDGASHYDSRPGRKHFGPEDNVSDEDYYAI